MFTLIRSRDFAEWLDDLKDQKALAQILLRLNRASFGNFGDWAPVGDGVSEMRLHYGPGYRIYFIQSGNAIYVLLCGGTKKTQKRDIVRAKRMVMDFKGGHE